MIGEYDFTELGFEGTFTDPTITDIPATEVNIQDVDKLLIAASVKLSGDGYNICLRLTSISVNDFSYNPTQLVDRIQKRLQDFKI